jgi:hypothetical protein
VDLNEYTFVDRNNNEYTFIATSKSKAREQMRRATYGAPCTLKEVKPYHYKIRVPIKVHKIEALDIPDTIPEE